jgi:putative ABC transport system ATP-binding protein
MNMPNETITPCGGPPAHTSRNLAEHQTALQNVAIVLADEPTGNLDSSSCQAVFELVRELNDQRATIAAITHERELAARLPRQIEMRDARIVSDNATEKGS